MKIIKEYVGGGILLINYVIRRLFRDLRRQKNKHPETILVSGCLFFILERIFSFSLLVDNLTYNVVHGFLCDR